MSASSPATVEAVARVTTRRQSRAERAAAKNAESAAANATPDAPQTDATVTQLPVRTEPSEAAKRDRAASRRRGETPTPDPKPETPADPTPAATVSAQSSGKNVTGDNGVSPTRQGLVESAAAAPVRLNASTTAGAPKPAGSANAKRTLAEGLIAAGAKLAAEIEIEGMTREEIGLQIGKWLAYLPTTPTWPTETLGARSDAGRRPKSA